MDVPTRMASSSARIAWIVAVAGSSGVGVETMTTGVTQLGGRGVDVPFSAMAVAVANKPRAIAVLTFSEVGTLVMIT